MSHAMLAHTWNWNYVARSFAIASLASYVSLELAARAGKSSMAAGRFWLVAQAFVLAYGIWAMHFVGMLAFKTEASVGYNIPLTVGSGLAAFAFVLPALFVAYAGQPSLGRMLAAGVVAGTGICVMHYTGMAAMQIGAQSSYNPLPFAASVLIAVSAATVAFSLFRIAASPWAAAQTRAVSFGLKASAGLVMGVAIIGMHYTGMAAVRYTVLDQSALGSALNGTDSGMLGLMIGVFTFLILGLAFVSIVMDAGSTLDDDLDLTPRA